MNEEDECVNRVASQISTLQHQASCSPCSETAAVAELVERVGEGAIDMQLALQVEIDGEILCIVCVCVSRKPNVHQYAACTTR